MDLWRSADEFVSIEAFREAAKSTLSEEFLALEGAFANSPYTLIIGETYDKGCQRLDSIKHEILSNRKLAELFGPLRGATWNENFIELKNGAVLQAAGWDQEMRGFNHRGNRPHRAYLDDIENKERVRDSETVDANWKRLWTELMPALDKLHRKIRITGTPLADDCMIRRCSNDPSFVHGFFPICNGDIDSEETKSLWPDRYPMEWIRAERDRYAAAGELQAFVQEYLLISAQTQNKPFTSDQVRFTQFAPPRFARRVAIIDPARTANVATSAHTGYVVLSRIGSTLYGHESDGRFMQPSEVVDLAFDLHERYGCEVCIEKNGLDEWLLQPLRVEMLRRGRALPIKPVAAPQDRDKTQFIAGLQPFFRAGDIVLIGDRVKHAKLMAQVTNFPSGKVDVLNALAYGPRVFGGEPLYPDFGDSNIVEGYEPEISAALVLGLAGNSTLTCAVLAAIEGQSTTILADWASYLPAQDSIKDIATVIRAMFRNFRVSACVPADLFDQQDRSPIVRTLRKEGIRVFRGDYAGASRGALTPAMRTEVRGRRLFRVDSIAVNTLQALGGGYQYPFGKGARQGAEPEIGAYRFIGEALEGLTSAVVSGHNEALPDGANLAVNALGSQYMTSLPRRAARG